MKKLFLILLAALAFGRSAIADTKLGPSTSITSPAIAGDRTTGLYTAGAGLIDVAVGGVKVGEWSSSGLALPTALGIINGGTAARNVSDALQTFSGVLNASACGKAQTPAWCSGSDIGAWVMAAYAYGHGQAWSQTKVIMDMTSTYNQSTQITKSASDILDCQGSNLIWQSTSGVAFAAGAVGGSVSKIGGNYNCNLTTAGGYSGGHTNVAIYSGGDPAGVINGVDATDANDIFFNFRVTGFKTPFTHGNNSWSSNLMFPSFSGNFYGIYGTPVLQGTVTAFAISSNVVTVTVSNSFTVGDVINITGLTTGTYLNKVPLTIATQSGSQFTASFTHANVSLVSDSGTAFDGYYNGGEPSTVYGGSISNNTDCGLDLNYTPDQWNVIATHLDYNTVAAACGASPNVDFTNAYIEQLQAPMVVHTGSSGTAIFRFDGGAQTATGTGTDNGFVTLTSVNDIATVRSVLFSSNHAVSYIVYTGALTGNSVTVENPMYEPGSTVGNSTPLTDGISFFSKYSGGMLIPSNSAIPFRAETFAAVGAHIDAPSLGTGSYFCNQLGLQLSTVANPNAQWCYYHGTGTGADTDKSTLGMFGRNGVITADASGVVGFDNSNLSALSGLYLDTNKHLTNTPPPVVSIASAATVDLCASAFPGQIVAITGTTTITSFGSTCPANSLFYVYFSGSVSVTNSATLNLSGGSNVSTGSGFPLYLCYVPVTPGTWYCSNPVYSPTITLSAGGSISTAGSASVGSVAVTNSGVPANPSIYRPASNTLGFATNTTAAGRVDSSQRLLWGYTADVGGGELFQVNSGIYANGKVTATNLLDSGLSASAPVVSTDASKNLTTTAPTQTANTVYAGPSSGGAASPTFRALVTADMPSGFIPILSGTSGSIGGGALLAGACSSGTATVTGATTSMVALVDPSTYPGDGAYWDGYVSSANTVTVKVCATVALTPTASTYNVRVLQ